MSETLENISEGYRQLSFREQQIYRDLFLKIAIVLKDFKLISALIECDAFAKYDIIDLCIMLIDETSIQSPEMEILEYLRVREKDGILPRNGYWKARCNTAVMFGKLNTLKWLHTHGLELTEYLCEIAAEKGYLNILKYLYSSIKCLDKGEDMFRYRVYLHAENNKDEIMLKFFKEIGFGPFHVQLR